MKKKIKKQKDEMRGLLLSKYDLKRLSAPATINSGYEPVDLKLSNKSPAEEIEEIQRRLKKRTLKETVREDIIEEIYLKRIRKLE